MDWCAAHGVQVSTRKGRADYHRATWPRRTRCKEGNLAFFYDHYGYERYDFVAQLDADHVPAAGYLEAHPAAFPRCQGRLCLRPQHLRQECGRKLVGPRPPLCRRRAARRAADRLQQRLGAALHRLPLRGTHRRAEEIGGLGPELAEDHSTTLMMNAHGWRGVHAIDAIAHGDGPTHIRGSRHAGIPVVAQPDDDPAAVHAGCPSPAAAEAALSVPVLPALVPAVLAVHAAPCISCRSPLLPSTSISSG